MLAVRQELRPKVGAFRFGFVQLEHLLRLSAARRHTVEAVGETGREQNHAVLVPRAAARRGFRLADVLRSATGDLYLLQILAAKERDRLAVRRPEWSRRAFRTLDHGGRSEGRR